MRPEEEARRDAQSAAARGEQPPPQEAVNVPVLEQHTHMQLLLVRVLSAPDGGKEVQFLSAGGVLHSFPLEAEVARGLGQQLTAPSVQVVGADEMPASNGHDPRAAG